jgi:hypothetical protein
MRLYTLTELFHLTRAELLALHAIASNFVQLPKDSEECEIAVRNLRRIRRVLAWSNFVPK